MQLTRHFQSNSDGLPDFRDHVSDIGERRCQKLRGSASVSVEILVSSIIKRAAGFRLIDYFSDHVSDILEDAA